jgi:TrmH family RNA methyltransferase
MPVTSISSRANPRVKQLRAAFAGQARLSGGLVAIEGEHLLFEAMRSGLPFKTIFIDERTQLPDWAPRSVELIELSGEVFSSAVDTQSPQGIAALLVPPMWEIESVLYAEASPVASPLVLIAGGLQDPGNLGTLIRSAEAFGVTAVLTTAGTVSPWNQKALRASAGSVFRVPLIACTIAEVAGLKLRGIRLYAAAAAGPGEANRSALPGDVDLSRPCGLLIGNEGRGLDDDLLALADERISIPMPGGVESLNAAIAGSLLLYEASRQRAASQTTADVR